jgi:hypothetical protein
MAPGARVPVTSPVAVRVCRGRREGSAISAPDPSSVLLVAADGREVLTTSSSHFAVAMPTGTHIRHVQLLDREHREYRPSIGTRVIVVVVGIGPLHAPASCGTMQGR